MKIAISYKSVFRILGWLLMIEALLMVIPFIVNIVERQPSSGFILGISGASVAGAILSWTCRFHRITIRRRESYLLVSISWIIFSIFGMLPFIFCRTPLGITDAFFETMSGFTTTGATTLPDVESLSKGILLWRAMTQWVGGLGIILFILALLPTLNEKGGIPMYNAETSGITHEKLHPRIRHTARSLWTVYLALTLAMTLLLWIGPMNFFDAICQSMACISTGGFSTRNNSIAWWNSDYISSIVTIFMLFGGVNFSLLYTACRGNARALWRNDVFRAYLAIIFVAYLAILASLLIQGRVHSFHDILVAPLFHAISAITSTGFTLDNFTLWGPFVILVTMLLMLSGACAGSTTGAIKVDRLCALRSILSNEIRHTVNPRHIYVIRVNGNILPNAEITRITAFVAIYIAVATIGALTISAFGYPITDSFFATLSCLGTNGLGYGDTAGYHLLPCAAKWVLSFCMLIGRLELFTFLVLLSPWFWKK